MFINTGEISSLNYKQINQIPNSTNKFEQVHFAKNSPTRNVHIIVKCNLYAIKYSKNDKKYIKLTQCINKLNWTHKRCETRLSFRRGNFRSAPSTYRKTTKSGNRWALNNAWMVVKIQSVAFNGIGHKLDLVCLKQ